MVRLALIGTGRAARARAREIRLCPEAQLAVVASAQPERAQALATEYETEAATGWEEAVTRPDVDAVIVSTYNERHPAIVRESLDAGKHVCVEYPLALSLADGQELLDLAAGRQRVLHIEHIDLLSPWFQTILEHLPEIGTLRSLVWQDISARQPQPRDWTFDRRSGFSLFAGASLLSRLVRIGGAVLHADAAETLDGLQPCGRFQRRLTTAHLRFADGVAALICDGTGFAASGPSSMLTITGSDGILHAEHRQHVTLTKANGHHEVPLMAAGGLFTRDLACFCGQILRGEPSYVPQGHVRRVLEAAEMARRSALSVDAAVR